ncbi:hypothetical protein [Pseudobacteriovorax antillogorgiicola]|uniref:His Kinase A (Phospho-acceptor) domain-containing protein n=1 Tax=Pseudobacteriovorax antillogorgiicola TaxID=1513793 RepID=A0A1Y6CAS3_9BACT|nr:hypothetical protein [Pseudobacteriovorax antillogorgiicola]TCS48693.1 hypothetical protein EDD56_117115 [Pseudobacteriovorax antillogorgiicola]SMF54776.1 hypothetical protein SAMN06296036_11744 [Pseudobacteriovorax antillogorgiicola]
MSAKDERKFMHDLSNPIAIAQGNIKLTLRKLKKDPNSLTIEQIVERLGKASEAFDRVSEMMSSRRQILLDQEEPESQAS